MSESPSVPERVLQGSLTDPNPLDLKAVLDGIEVIAVEQLGGPLPRLDDSRTGAHVVLTCAIDVVRAHLDHGTELEMSPYLRATIGAAYALRYAAAHDPIFAQPRHDGGTKTATQRAASRLRANHALAVPPSATSAAVSLARASEVIAHALLGNEPLGDDTLDRTINAVNDAARAMTQYTRVAPNYVRAPTS